MLFNTSGTNALMMATILSNLKPFDKVIISNLAWVAATNPVLIMGGNINVVDLCLVLKLLIIINLMRR